MFLEHCKIPPKYIVLFKGDDSDFDGNQEIAIDIDTQLSLEGVKAHFRFLDFSQYFDSIPEDRRLLLVFPRESTRKFPLGAMDATLTFEDAQGRTRTIANRIHIVVTNSVGEAYWNEDPQAITVVMSGDEYLKNAEVSEDGKTLTITKKDGTEVQFRGGGGGGGAVSSVNGKTGAVVLTGADIKTSETDTQTISAKLSAKQDTLTDDQKAVLDGGPYVPKNGGEFSGDVTLGGTVRLEGSGDSSFHRLFITGSRYNQGLISIRNSSDCEIGTELLMSGGLTSGARIALENGRNGDPATITKGGKEVATEDQLRVTMQLVGNDPYTVQLDGVTQTFAEIKTYAQTRNAVIQRGQGTYRVTYIGANEMMWDVTGTVQGEVKTGQIHIFDQDGATVVQRVEPKTLATKTMLDSKADKISDTVVAKIDEERHDDNIVVRIMRVPIEFARKAFNAVRMSFHQDDRDEASFMAIGYSTGNGGTSGVTYDDIVVELSSDYFFKNESGSHIYNFSQNVTSKIPSEAKFLTFFFFDDSEMEYSGTAPIETGYATTEEEQQKKYQIQTQNAGFFYTDHAPLIDFLMVNDPVARESILSSDKFKSAVEAVFDNGETEAF